MSIARRFSGSSIMRRSCLLRGWPSFTLNMRRPPSSASPLVESFLRFAGEPVAEHVLLFHELIDQRLEPVVLMGRNRRRPADDERRARFVDQDGIDFVDDGEVITALHLLLARRGHAVVAQVIETELRVRAVGDVAGVLLAAQIGRLIVLDDARRQAEETVKLAHPSRASRRAR